jgi:hypothetical protein
MTKSNYLPAFPMAEVREGRRSRIAKSARRFVELKTIPALLGAYSSRPVCGPYHVSCLNGTARAAMAIGRWAMPLRVFSGKTFRVAFTE